MEAKREIKSALRAKDERIEAIGNVLEHCLEEGGNFQGKPIAKEFLALEKQIAGLLSGNVTLAVKTLANIHGIEAVRAAANKLNLKKKMGEI